ncbi:MAG TPA: DHH family phosphoesterase [Candidatus Binatus sp.]|nr:DHH family phosphoesterase [Candidatus Binatus sp.]
MVGSHGRFTLFCHQNADPDSVCSAIGLKKLVETGSHGVNGAISCPRGISAPTKQLVRNLGLPMPEFKVTGEIGVAVMVDTNNLEQLGSDLSRQIVQSSCPLVVIDHHQRHPDTEKLVKLGIIDPNSSSTAEIVASLYKVGHLPMDRVVAEALLAAVFVETRYFALANEATFQHAWDLARQGADPKTVPSLLAAPSGRSERMARLKAAQRLRIESLDDWIIVVSEVGSYQSSSARALLSLGGDISIVAGKVKELARVNLRSTEKFHRSTGIHLGRDVAIPVGSALGGSGGGHPTAAGLEVANASVEKAVNECIVALRRSVARVGLVLS